MTAKTPYTSIASLTLFAFSALLSGACGNGKPAVDPSESDPKSEIGGGDSTSAPSASASATASGKPQGGGRVNEKGERSLNTYDKEQTDVVLARAARQVKQNCGATKDENGVATGPWEVAPAYW